MKTIKILIGIILLSISFGAFSQGPKKNPYKKRVHHGIPTDLDKTTRKNERFKKKNSKSPKKGSKQIKDNKKKVAKTKQRNTFDHH